MVISGRIPNAPRAHPRKGPDRVRECASSVVATPILIWALGSGGRAGDAHRNRRVVRAQAQALVVTVAGEIDVFTAKRLRAALAAGFDQLRGGEVLIIDLTDVTFLGSPGLQTAAGPRRLPWFGWP